MPGINSDMDSWAELAALYMELGFDHFAQVAFSSYIARYALLQAVHRCIKAEQSSLQLLLRYSQRQFEPKAQPKEC